MADEKNVPTPEKKDDDWMDISKNPVAWGAVLLAGIAIAITGGSAINNMINDGNKKKQMHEYNKRMLEHQRRMDEERRRRQNGDEGWPRSIDENHVNVSPDEQRNSRMPLVANPANIEVDSIWDAEPDILGSDNDDEFLGITPAISGKHYSPNDRDPKMGTMQISGTDNLQPVIISNDNYAADDISLRHNKFNDYPVINPRKHPEKIHDVATNRMGSHNKINQVMSDSDYPHDNNYEDMSGIF